MHKESKISFGTVRNKQPYFIIYYYYVKLSVNQGKTMLNRERDVQWGMRCMMDVPSSSKNFNGRAKPRPYYFTLSNSLISCESTN